VNFAFSSPVNTPGPSAATSVGITSTSTEKVLKVKVSGAAEIM
jgi:hypothetical protein